MQNRGHALARDELVRVLTAYTGITTAIGGVGGTTLVDSNLINNPLVVPAAIPEKSILILTGTSAGEDKGAASFNNVTGAITLQGTGFNTQIKAGTIYRILNISSVEIDVANINTKIGTNVDLAGTTTLFAWLANIFAGAGKLQIAETTIDLDQGIASYPLFTGTAQDVIVEKLIISMPNIVAGGALTSISIQTNDATPQVFIDNVLGAVANLTAEAQLAYVGTISVHTGKLIQLSILGGATGVAYVCDVEVQYRAVVAGGHLA